MSAEWRKTGPLVPKIANRKGGLDLAIAELASRQHGVAALAQLRVLGLSPSAMRKRVEAGRFHRIHAGVFAVGHTALRVEGRWMAAILASGPGAVLSHRPAAALLDLRPHDGLRVDVIAPNRRGRGQEGITPHHQPLSETEITEVSGIPCTTMTRTLIDIAPLVSLGALRRACNQAELRNGVDFSALRAAAAGSRRGAKALRTVLADLAPEPELTRSELEERFLDLCRRVGIPRPSVNAVVPVDGGALEVDFCWRSQRLIVEADGRRFHGTESAFERDRRRDQQLAVAGWRVIRCTWLQVTREPGDLAGTIEDLLAA